MSTWIPVNNLINGFPDAADGVAWFYLPGTTTPVVIAGDDTGTPTTNPAPLNSNGAATVYVDRLARMVVQDINGATVADIVANETTAALTTNTSSAFTGDTQEDVDDAAQVAFGGKDFFYVPSGSWVGMTPKAWMNGVVRNVMAYGSVGATQINDGVTPADTAIAAAIADVQAQGGGTVFFPKGVYLCNAAIAINATGVTLAGVARGASTIKINSTTLNGLVFTSANGSVVRDLRITTPVASSGTGIKADVVSGFQVLNVKVDGFDVPLYTLNNTEDVFVQNSEFNATNAVASARAYLCDDTTSVTIIGGTFEGASTGYAMEFLGDTGGVVVTGASVGTGTTAIRFDATIALSGFRFVGNASSSTNVFSFGGATMPGGFYQAGNGVDGYTGGLLTGATFTPDLSKGCDIMIDATTTGVAYTVAVPSVPPVSTSRGFYMTLTFYCHAGGAITGWGVAAGYHLSSGPSTVDTHKTTYLLRWDGAVWHEVSRSDTT